MGSNQDNSTRRVGVFGETIVSSPVAVVQQKFSYGIHPESIVQSTAGAGNITTANDLVVLSTGAQTNSDAHVLTKEVGVYQPGQGLTTSFSAIFSTPKEGSQQIIGIGDEENGYFIGYNGTVFSVLRRRDSVDTWTVIENVSDGSSEFRGQLDPTLGNIYKISVQWFGFGPITWEVQDPKTKDHIVLHTEFYSNKNTIPSAFNPSFPFHIDVNNTTNDTDISVKSSSFAIFIEGKPTSITDRHAATSAKTITTETNILTIRSKATYSGVTNRAVMFPDIFSYSSDGTKTTIIRLYANATLGGVPVYNDVDTAGSVAEFDIAGTTVTGGTLIMVVQLPKEGADKLVLDNVFKLFNLDTITISAESALSSIVNASISWSELR